MPTVKIQATYKTQACSELEEHFLNKILKTCFSCSLQPVSELSKQWVFQQKFGRETPKDSFQPEILNIAITKKQSFQNQKWLLQKAEKANLKNSETRKSSTQFYTAARTFSVDNCTMHLYEDECLDRKILFLPSNTE